jgi:uncharacterized membrane protein YccC
MFRIDRNSEEQAEKAEEHLRQQLSFARDMGTKDPSNLNSIAARNILHEDLGRFDTILHRYQLDDDTRNRLIAHVRQDAAHALLNTATLLQQVRALRRGLRIVLVLVFLLLVALGLPLLWLLSPFLEKG